MAEKNIQIQFWDSATSQWILINPKTKAELVVGLDTLLAGKVDVVAGMGLSEESYTTVEKTKLAGIEEGANLYVHPETHAPSIIAQDVDNRFVTDVQIAAWNAKEDAANKGVANGYASLDANAKVPLAQLPDTAKGQTFVVADSTARAAIVVGTLLAGDKAYETTTGDSYIWDGTQWLILAQADWENVNLSWANIVNGPTSAVADIDDAVTKRHEHSNKTLLDKLTEGSVNASYDLAAFLTSVSWDDILDKPTEFPVAAHTHAPADVLTDENNRFVTDAEKAVWNAKTKIVMSTTQPLETDGVDIWFQEIV